MSKIAKIIINKNSLREIFTSVNPVNTNGIFKQTDKGHAIYLDNTADLDGYGVFSNVKTIVFAIRPFGNTKLFLDNNSDKLEINGGNYSGTGLTENTVFINSETDTDAASFNQWQMVISEFNGGINFATDLEIDPTSNIYLGYEIIMYDHILTQIEKNNLYQEFLNSKPLGATKRNFHYPKPTDLSNEAGLVAAYNMIPSNGELVDISGNGYTGVIEGPLSTKDGIKYDGIDDYVVENTVIGEDFKTIVFSLSSDTGISHTSSAVILSNKNVNVPIIVKGDVSGTFPDETISLTTSSVVITYIKDIVPSDILFNLILRWNGTSYDFWINGIQRTTYQGATSHHPIISNIAFALCKRLISSALPFGSEMTDFRIYSRSWTDQEIIDYNNKHAKQVTFIDDFKYEPADGTNILPHGWTPGTGSFKISELMSDISQGLIIGTKTLECTSGGNISHQYKKDDYIDGGNLKMNYYNGSSWINVDTDVDNAISTYSWLSFSGNKMIYTLSIGDKITNIKYTKRTIV